MIAFSEAAAIAVHAMIFLAAAEDRPHALKEISTAYAVSDNHLSKVLQKLVKAGYLVSVKGPKGGYQIASGKRSATLMEIYEAIEGPWQASSCLFSGDTLFCESYGRYDFPTSSGRDLVASVKRLLRELPENVKVYPGHNESTEIGYEKRYNPLA